MISHAYLHSNNQMDPYQNVTNVQLMLLIHERLFSIYLKQSCEQVKGMATSKEPIRQLLSRPDLIEKSKNLQNDYLTCAQHQYQNLLQYLRKLKQDHPDKACILFVLCYIYKLKRIYKLNL